MENGITPVMNVGSGYGDGFGGNSAIWLFALLILFGMGGFGGGFGNRGGFPNDVATTQDVTYTSAFNQLQDENNAIINTIGNTRNDIISAVKDTAYNNLSEIRDLESSVNAGFANMQNCCCTIQRGIDSVNYNGAINTASINANTTAQTQKILDAISGNRIADLQNQVNALQLQTAMCGVVKYPNAFVYSAGNSPFCNGCGCGNGSF